jgi:hypothetical protein
MNTELDDIQVGMYLGCLYQQRQNVLKNKKKILVFIFIVLFSLKMIVVVN